MADDLFSNYSSVGSFSTSEASGEESSRSWVVKQNKMVFGPMSTEAVINQILSGQLKGNSLAAMEGSDEFHPLKQLHDFKRTVIKAQAIADKRAAKKSMIITSIVVVLLLAIAGGAGYYAYTTGYFNKAEEEALAAKKALSLDDIPELKLVGLADLVSAAESITVKNEEQEEEKAPEDNKQKAVAKKPKAKAKPKASGATKAAEEVVQGCQLPTKDIIAVVQRSAGRWVGCIQHLQESDPNLVPAKLVLSFTVTPAGKLINFEVGNRELRSHPVKNCLLKEFRSMTFPQSNGTNCNVDNWGIPLKK